MPLERKTDMMEKKEESWVKVSEISGHGRPRPSKINHYLLWY
jgi:hypothetical protein